MVVCVRRDWIDFAEEQKPFRRDEIIRQTLFATRYSPFAGSGKHIREKEKHMIGKRKRAGAG
jgi:hypothetical protein